MTQHNFRVESDLLGPAEVPADAYYGVHSLRAVQNFPITGVPIGHYSDLVNGLAYVKAASARANHQLGQLSAERASAIEIACQRICDGELHDQFVIDLIQGGAGTSSNMNANEVVANLALEIMGHQKGDYGFLHPNDHVNLGQSTNDAYPTALRVGLYLGSSRLLNALAYLEEAFNQKAAEFKDYIKLGRTQMQEAVPMTLGQEFKAFASMLAEEDRLLRHTMTLLTEVNLGGTAIGTGLNAHHNFAETAVAELAHLSGVPVECADNLVEATQDVGALVQYSSALKRIAVKMSKIAHDLRLLSSGPQAGLADITLPPVQAGSSIMPGKVNPVIPEMVSQVAYAVIGNDVTVTMAAEAGQLQLNAFEPVMAKALFESVHQLTAAATTLADRTVRGIGASREGLMRKVRESVGLATALVPFIGYEKATHVAKEARATGKDVPTVVVELGYLSRAEVDDILAHPDRLVTNQPLSDKETREPGMETSSLPVITPNR